MKFVHVTISVRDLEESLRFYQDIIGLSLNRRFAAGSDVEIAFLGDGEMEIELICDKNRKDVVIGQDISLGFSVESMQDSIQFLQSKGIATGEVLRLNKGLQMTFISDPNGVRVQLVEYTK